MLIIFLPAAFIAGRPATRRGTLFDAQVDLPAGPLRLVLRQVVPLDVGPALCIHHNVLRLRGMEKLQSRVLAKGL